MKRGSHLTRFCSGKQRDPLDQAANGAGGLVSFRGVMKRFRQSLNFLAIELRNVRMDIRGNIRCLVDVTP